MSMATGRAQDACARTRLDAVVAYLSGPLRGRAVPIEGETLHFAQPSGMLLTAEELGDSPHSGTLIHTGVGYELVVPTRQAVWVNGDPVDVRTLESGDLIEIVDGPVLRFWLDPSGAMLRRDPKTLFAEGASAAPRWPMPLWTLALRWLGTGGPRAAITRARHSSRTRALIGLASLVAILAYLGLQTHELAQRFAAERNRVSGMLGRLEGQTLTRGELGTLRDEFDKGRVATDERIKTLEHSSAAVGHVIAHAAGSVALVQGSFGFQDRATKRLLRLVVTRDGSPLRMPDGRPQISLEGSGPALEIRFGGTAFVVAEDGVLLTNRHIALPWEGEASLPAIRATGLVPVMHRMRGFLPGTADSFEVKLLGVSDTHDVAILQGDGAARDVAPLPLSTEPPTPGEAAVLLGFPTGIRALLARAGDAFVARLSGQTGLDLDHSTVALAQAGLIQPLASRGIVGQVSGEAIVYDAQTAAGGSGGPVLNLKGNVMAINRSTLPEFGGSNIGVPARHALELMQKLKIGPDERPRAIAR